MTSDAARQRAEARVGSTLKGKYTIDRLIGMGGMGSVYAAKHRNGNRVAIKLLHPELSLDMDVLRRFLREGYAANRIAHPGAVLVLDDDVTDDGAAYLVMELLQGESVEAQWTRAGQKLPPETVARVALGALDVLAQAHARGVVHRDVKPDNLFSTREGRLKVLDFGIARLSDGPGSASATRSGRMMGTPAFMPPEQALGRRDEIDARADVWAMGATMFTLLSGRYVHEAGTMEEMVVHAATRHAAPVQSLVPATPAGIAAVVNRALAFTKEKRWADAGEMHQALSEAYEAAFAASAPKRYVPESDVEPIPEARTAVVPAPASADASARMPTAAVGGTTPGITQSAATGPRRGRAGWIVGGSLAVVSSIIALAFEFRPLISTRAVGGDPVTAPSTIPSAAPPDAAPTASVAEHLPDPAPSGSNASVAASVASAAPLATPKPARPDVRPPPRTPPKKKVDPYLP